MFSFILICKHASWHKSKMPLSTLLIFNPMPVCSVFQFLLEGINNSSLNKFRSQLFTSHQALHSLRAFPSVKWQIKTIRGKGNRRKLVSPYVIACQFLTLLIDWPLVQVTSSSFLHYITLCGLIKPQDHRIKFFLRFAVGQGPAGRHHLCFASMVPIPAAPALQERQPNASNTHLVPPYGDQIRQ